MLGMGLSTAGFRVWGVESFRALEFFNFVIFSLKLQRTPTVNSRPF